MATIDDFYPADIRIFLDDVDITYFIFGTDTFDPNQQNFLFTEIDLTSFITTHGMHRLTVSAGVGSGRVDARIEIA